MQVDFQAAPYDGEIIVGSLDLNQGPHEIDHFAGQLPSVKALHAAQHLWSSKS